MTDHERGCQGREYTCTCGYDADRDALIKKLVKALERIASVCSDRSEKTGWRIDSISDEADAALAAAKEIAR